MTLVVLSGGNGSRLQPLSRKQYPKQLLALTGDDTPSQQTIKYLAFGGTQAPLLVYNKERCFVVQGQLEAQNLASQAVLLEPFGHSTVPAVTITAMKLVAENRGELLLILPTDHVIEDRHALQQTLTLATNAAEKGEVVPFDIPASRLETSHGYIRMSADAQLPEGVSRVQSFVRKPNEAHARRFVAAGGYYWNSDMFLFRVNCYLEELKKHGADIYDTCLLALERSQYSGDLVNIDAATFERCPDNPIDYAVIRKTSRTCVVPLPAGWNDVGSWSSIWGVYVKGVNSNVTKSDVLVHDSHSYPVYGNGKPVSVIGLKDIVVMKTKGAMMIAHKGRVQDVKHMVKDLGTQSRSETQDHCGVYRPWGSYDSVDMGGRFQVKHITVKPDAHLSLQVHYHRAECWIVVSGTAQMTCDDKTFLLAENQSAYISIASVHRLASPGRIPLEVIEVQSGSYLGKDDIERLGDIYGRTTEPALQVVAGSR